MSEFSDMRQLEAMLERATAVHAVTGTVGEPCLGSDELTATPLNSGEVVELLKELKETKRTLEVVQTQLNLKTVKDENELLEAAVKIQRSRHLAAARGKYMQQMRNALEYTDKPKVFTGTLARMHYGHDSERGKGYITELDQFIASMPEGAQFEFSVKTLMTGPHYNEYLEDL